MKSAIAPSDKFLTHLANDFPVSSEIAPCKDPVAAIKSATNTEVLGPSSFHNDGAALLNLSPSIQSSCIKAPQCTNSSAIPHSKARCVSQQNESDTHEYYNEMYENEQNDEDDSDSLDGITDIEIQDKEEDTNL